MLNKHGNVNTFCVIDFSVMVLIIYTLGYLIDSNTEAHSVDTDII